MKAFVPAAVLALVLVVDAGRSEAGGIWIGAGVPVFPPPCAPPPVAYAYPPAYYYPYPYVYSYPWAPPLAYAPYVRGPEYWYYRSLRRDDFYDRPRIHGYTLR